MQKSCFHRGIVFIASAALTLLSFSPVTAIAQQSHGDHESTSGHHDTQGGVDHWLARLEDPDRDAHQRPTHVIDLLEITDGMTVVDLGAGTGYFLGHLSAAVGKNGSVLGLDVDQELVDFMNQRAKEEGWGNVHARKVATNDPELAAKSVDRILIVNTWHHIDTREAYARKLLSALKSDGAIYVVDLTEESPYGPPPDHRLSSDRVEAELAGGGLTTEVIDEELPYQYIVVARR